MKILTGIIAIGIFLFAAFYAVSNYMQEAAEGTAPVLPPPAEDGEHFGFIHEVAPNLAMLVFDDALWLVGAPAQDAAIAAGLCTEETRDDCTPNGYFIQNDAVRDERVLISPNTRVLMQTFRMEETGSVEGREITLSDFAALINNSAQHWRMLPYTVTVLDGAIVRIEEMYIP